MKAEEAIKLFGLNNLSIEADLRKIEKNTGYELGHGNQKSPEIDKKYYPQFTEKLRREAENMAKNYVIFYCLENSIREILSERLEEMYGPEWWFEKVPENVRKNAEANRKKELASGVTPRSTDLIDFTNFGELGEIIKTNWDIFGDLFRDVRAVERVLSTLNTLRAPIAHCTSLAEDEELRLHLGLRDWFRQMG